MEPKNNNVGVTHVSDLAAHYWQVTFHREERSQVVLARFWLYLHACMCSLKCSLKCSLNSYSVPICKIQNFRIEFHQNATQYKGLWFIVCIFMYINMHICICMQILAIAFIELLFHFHWLLIISSKIQFELLDPVCFRRQLKFKSFSSHFEFCYQLRCGIINGETWLSLHVITWNERSLRSALSFMSMLNSEAD